MFPVPACFLLQSSFRVLEICLLRVRQCLKTSRSHCARQLGFGNLEAWAGFRQIEDKHVAKYTCGNCHAATSEKKALMSVESAQEAMQQERAILTRGQFVGCPLPDYHNVEISKDVRHEKSRTRRSIRTLRVGYDYVRVPSQAQPMDHQRAAELLQKQSVKFGHNLSLEPMTRQLERESCSLVSLTPPTESFKSPTVEEELSEG
ncbi:hypothetical protein C8J56DRAFT_893194 [Mycena floridula]|nr:hypothetical protein C8J56DRAFT_893194 [Mycena floridula]